jgi:hypothetical protein
MLKKLLHLLHSNLYESAYPIRFLLEVSYFSKTPYMRIIASNILGMTRAFEITPINMQEHR